MFAQFGFALSTFEDAPIKLKAVELHNVFGERKEVIELFKSYYVNLLKWQALSLISSSQLLGNPNQFLTSLGTGFKELYYEPYEGYIRGGLGHATYQVLSGAGGLAVTTVSGGISLASKIGSSISQGIL
jgi:vacuolar protein sorting-associated protein 13A/C